MGVALSKRRPAHLKQIMQDIGAGRKLQYLQACLDVQDSDDRDRKHHVRQLWFSLTDDERSYLKLMELCCAEEPNTSCSEAEIKDLGTGASSSPRSKPPTRPASPPVKNTFIHYDSPQRTMEDPPLPKTVPRNFGSCPLSPRQMEVQFSSSNEEHVHPIQDAAVHDSFSTVR